MRGRSAGPPSREPGDAAMKVLDGRPWSYGGERRRVCPAGARFEGCGWPPMELPPSGRVPRWPLPRWPTPTRWRSSQPFLRRAAGDARRRRW